MVKNTLLVGVLYAALLYTYGKYVELRAKLYVTESELGSYKSLVDSYLDESTKVHTLSPFKKKEK